MNRCEGFSAIKAKVIVLQKRDFNYKLKLAQSHLRITFSLALPLRNG